jgi:hypothetical protein
VAPSIEIHGFVSQGGFVSTANDYLGRSSRGSLELFEAAFNASTQITDRLRAGIQLFSRNVGEFDDLSPRLDWAFLDYRWNDRLGLRAGIIKLPFGLFNEVTDVDAARLPILLPQSVYPLRNRDVFLAHTGFALYGSHPVGPAGAVEGQVWVGTLTIPRNALLLDGASLESIDTRYAAGAQLYWLPPVDGLRVGATFLRASIDFHLTLSPENVDALIMAGVVPPDYDGALRVSQRPTWAVIGSAEYARGAWLFAAEYSRRFKRQETSLPMVIPAFEQDSEAFYGMVAYRAWSRAAAGLYYSVLHADADDRRGRGPQWPAPHRAFQRDLAATIQIDVNHHWLWKVEGHFVDGTADLPTAIDPTRYWGLFLLRTTVTF